MDNYFDGAWRPVVGDPDKALDVLRRRGFEIGADEGGRLMARWPVAPAAPFTFEGIPLEYWREEVRLNCAVSLERLRHICQERGAPFEQTLERLRS